MSWINDNKFVAALIGVTAVVSGGILFFGFSQSGEYEEKLGVYEELKGDLLKVSKFKPYPDAEGLAVREKGIAEYEKTINSVSSAFQDYMPGEMKSLTPEEFSDARVSMEKKLKSTFAEAGIKVPPRCNFGFEKYAKVQADAKATSKLNFQLKAVESLLAGLVESKPDTLLNLKRSMLPIEEASVGASNRGARPSRSARNSRANRSNRARKDESSYQRLPMELAFTGSEASVCKFLRDMIASEDYFYNINLLRIKNEKQKAPSQSDIGFQDDSTVGDVSGGNFSEFFDDNEEGDGAEVALSNKKSGAEIAKQILGNELLHVHLVFDVILIKAPNSEKE